MRRFLLVSSVAACAFGIPSFAGAVPSPSINDGAVATKSVHTVRLAQGNPGLNSPGNQQNGPGGTQAENSQSPCNKNGTVVTPSHPNNGFGNCGEDGIPGNGNGSAGTPGGSQDNTR